MFVSVVITTYNQPAWLEHVLWSYSAQSHEDFELIVAEDGSTAETAQVIQRLRGTCGMAIRHVWHEDCGFRKCRILNRATDAASGDYIVFSDGDCIVRRDFVAEHVRLAEPGGFLSGGVVRLPRALSHAIQRDDILSGNVHSPRWLLANGMPFDKKLRMLAAGKRTGRCLDRLLTTRATFNGHNASAWREDLIQVNGFDERMQYGGLDRELGERGFLRPMADFIYGTPLTVESIQSIQHLKAEIERRNPDRREVKAGWGGIRDIEFTVQFLQLPNGREYPEVRTSGTLPALRRLQEVGALTAEERIALTQTGSRPAS